MNELQVVGFQSFEKMLLQRGFVICQATGQRINHLDDLAVVQVMLSDNQTLHLPVHKKHVQKLMKSLRVTFSKGAPTLDEDAFQKFEYLD